MCRRKPPQLAMRKQECGLQAGFPAVLWQALRWRVRRRAPQVALDRTSRSAFARTSFAKRGTVSMATSEAQTFRIPFLLLAAANLAGLGTLLWPWQEAINLPPNGTTAVDPAVILLAYLGLIYWVPNGIQEQTRKALSLGATIGILAGLI